MNSALETNKLGIASNISVFLKDGVVSWVGANDMAPHAEETLDATGMIGLPGLVDCHTHAVWGGSRADEFRRRLGGEDYSSILESGGGILSTVRQTRAASAQALEDATLERLTRFLDRGVTTVEVKSGYGLDPFHERRMLEIAKSAGARLGIRVLTTFLGAHAVPEAFRGRREEYVRQVIEEQLPAVSDVADFIDVYVDRGAFSVEEGRRILRAGREAGLQTRIHAEQVAYTGAAEMAAEEGALSADHLERIDAAGIAAMAKADTVAVLLPGAMLYLRDVSPPVAEIRAAGVKMAIATDMNPGSSPVDDIWSCATLACLTMGLTVEEALLGITRNGALALGRKDLGVIKVGASADIALFRPYREEEADASTFVQYLSGPKAERVVCGGKVIL